MLARGRGELVQFGSLAGWLPSPRLGAYSATKAAVITFSETLAHELAGTGVQVVCVCPPVVDTPMLAQVRDDGPRSLARVPPIRPEVVLDSIERVLDRCCGSGSTRWSGHSQQGAAWRRFATNPHLARSKVSAMPERTSHAPGTPSWIDLGAPDVDAAAEYYSSLFGWTFEDLGDEAGGYRMARIGGKDVAGLGPAQAPGPPYWTTYVTTDDVEATTAKVEKAGGAVVVPPMDVMEAGRMAVYQDAEGAFVSAWQPGRSIGAEVVNEHGALCWNELNTRDLGKAKAFYGDVFGWEANDSEAYTEWQLGGRVIGGAMAMGENFPPEVPPNWLVYFAVDDVDATAAKAAELGGTVIAGPITVDVGTFVVLADPQGAVSAVIQLDQPGD
jgi:hypothetical protein